MTKLIHEFAVEPAVLADWQNARYILDQCGVPHGKILSDFPDNWLEQLDNELVHASVVNRKRIKELLVRKKSVIWNYGRLYDATQDWPGNAIRENGSRPFSGIIFNQPNSAMLNTSCIEDLDDSLPWWKIPRNQKIVRSSGSLAEAATELLQMSKQILFVDPHFNPAEERFIQPLLKWIGIAITGKIPCRIEYHTNANKGLQPSEYKQELESRLSPRLPALPEGTIFSVVRWREKRRRHHSPDTVERMHGRYILTEIGGIQIDHGLDADQNSGSTTDIHLMDDALYNTRWKDYQVDGNVFDFDHGWFVDRDGTYPIKPRNGNLVPSDEC